MADTRTFGQATLREGLDASFGQLVLGGIQQGRGKVTVVIGAYPRQHDLHLDIVKIFSPNLDTVKSMAQYCPRL